ncbi:MAG: FG-GAP repeat protein, partial [Marinicella sp.]
VGAYRDNDNGFDSGSAYVYDYAGGSWSQSQKLTANDDQAFDQFGFTVVLSGNRLLIGSIRDDDNGIDSGSAYVYDYVGGSWSLSQKINPNDGSLNDHFAHAISLAGDRVLVGVYRDDDYGIESGSAYVYDYVAGNWSQSQKLSAGDGAARDSFGYSVSLSGARALVGAFQDNDDGNNSGAAYIYDYTGSSWSLSQKLTAGDAQLGDEFGYSVSLSGDRALISALRDDDNGNESGSVYVFDYAGGSWSESEKITADDGTANDWFGSSVSLSGNRILVGARLDDDNGSGSGSAYVFDYVGGSWSQSQKLIAADGAAGDYFGFSVSLSGDRALVGAFKGDDIDNGNESGSAYVFDFAAGSWSQTQKITANDGSQGDQFGVSVSLSGDRALIGAYLDDDAFSFSGSAYVFDFVGGSWLQSQKLIASDAAFGDYFGYSVSLEGDRALIGSYLDDDNGSFSGSAYVFEYVDGSWSESQKMISSDGASNDFLGISVSLSGDRVLLGAYADDDNGNNSGAAYVFNLDPQYEVNVSVTGLAGGSLNLINGGDDIAINADGTQTLSVLSDGSPFDVDITAQPTMPNQVCSFTNDDSGTINGMDATVTIHCETIQYDVNINVSGLLGDGVSISNVGDTLTINTDGIETISTFDDGSAYAVLLTSQPSEPNQVCTISGGNSGDDNGSGTLVGTDVTIEVDCVTEQYSIGVEVSGLTSGNSLILQNNGSDDLTVTENGASFFATTLDDGSAYLVSVNTQPTEPNQTCVVSSPMGNLNGGDVGLMVTCSTNQYSVGGMVSGLATGNFVTLSMNGGFEYLVVDGNSYFEFNHSLEDESSYSITVFNNPTSPNQTCDVTNGVGTLMGGDVIDIEIDCEINQYFIGGYATNLIPDNNLLLQNNDGDDLVVPESGAFAFKTP